MEKLVSIIINCHNGEEYLSDALDSVLAQTYSHWELIFFDNCSTDNSKKIFKGYSDSRFKYFLSDNFCPLYEARDRAIGKCCGDFIAFLDVDDLWMPQKLELQLITFEDDDVGLSCTNFLVISDRGEGGEMLTRRIFDRLPSGYVLDEIFSKYFIHMSSLMIRKIAYFSLINGFNPNYNIVGDIDLVVRLNLKWKLSSVQIPCTSYRYHENNTGNKQSHLLSQELKMLYDDLKMNFPEVLRKSNFKKFENKVFWHLVIKEIDEGFKIKYLKHLSKLSPENRIKLILTLFIPSFLIKKYISIRNRTI